VEAPIDALKAIVYNVSHFEPAYIMQNRVRGNAPGWSTHSSVFFRRLFVRPTAFLTSFTLLKLLLPYQSVLL